MFKVVVKPYSQILCCQDWGDVSATNSDFGRPLNSANDQEFGLIVIEFQLMKFNDESSVQLRHAARLIRTI